MSSNVTRRELRRVLLAWLLFGIGCSVLGVAYASTSLTLSTDAANSARPAVEAFERFKKMEGKWKGRSTKGWEETIVYKIIAAGSVVVEDSLDAHPSETMMTMFHLDGDRLMLTHYCVAKNQPRMVATSFADGGKTVTFTFLDGTNLPNRDRGHMNKAVFHFLDENHVSTQWTWYQKGKESWMEEIKLERLPTD